MKKDDLIKSIVEKTDISKEKAVVVLDQMFVSRAIPSVLRDKVFTNIAKDSEISFEQAQKAMGAVIGKLTEDPAIFELAANQLAAAWFNDCDGCNNCGGNSGGRQVLIQQVEKSSKK
jgi:hypothetical protein